MVGVDASFCFYLGCVPTKHELKYSHLSFIPQRRNTLIPSGKPSRCFSGVLDLYQSAKLAAVAFWGISPGALGAGAMKRRFLIVVCFCGMWWLQGFYLIVLGGEAWGTATGEDDGPRLRVLALVLLLMIEYILEQSLFPCVVCVLRCWAFVAGTWGKIGVMSLDLKERFCKGYFG